MLFLNSLAYSCVLRIFGLPPDSDSMRPREETSTTTSQTLGKEYIQRIGSQNATYSFTFYGIRNALLEYEVVEQMGRAT